MVKPTCILPLLTCRLQLDAKLRDALTGRSSLFAEAAGGAGLAASLRRPLLCLFDRNFEMSVVLQHAWTYKPLVNAVGCGAAVCGLILLAGRLVYTVKQRSRAAPWPSLPLGPDVPACLPACPPARRCTTCWRCT
jgi:hypothetical protein